MGRTPPACRCPAGCPRPWRFLTGLAPGLARLDAELPEAEAPERAASWPEAPDARAPGPAVRPPPRGHRQHRPGPPGPPGPTRKPGLPAQTG